MEQRIEPARLAAPTVRAEQRFEPARAAAPTVRAEQRFEPARAAAQNGRVEQRTVHARAVARDDGLTRATRSLLVLQAALGLTAVLGVVLLSGPAAAIGPLLYAAALFVLAARLHRPWARWAVVGVEGIALAGFGLQQLAGLLPQLDATVNLAALLTTLALPVVLVVLAARLLTRG